MATPRARRIAGWFLAAVVTACGGCSGCGNDGPPSGSTSTPSPAPPGEVSSLASTGEEGDRLEIIEAFVESSGKRTAETLKAISFLAPADRLVIRAAAGSPAHEERIQWTVKPHNEYTGVAKLISGPKGKELIFTPSSRRNLSGSRRPNPPLEYEVVASLEVGKQKLEARLPEVAVLFQDEIDIIRQEYRDYGTAFQPPRGSIRPPARPSLNTGNYTLIAEEQPGALEKLLTQVNQKATALINNDVQVMPVGRRGLASSTVVVAPGDPINEVGPLGDTDPKGDDVCGGPLVDGACAGPVLAGPNGIAETKANNRGTRIDIERFVTSAYRNPQRNRAAGSKALNSRHTRGMALDIDPRTLRVRGKTARHMMCVIEQAGALVVGSPKKSFTERGATTFLDCDSPVADHVHVNF